MNKTSLPTENGGKEREWEEHAGNAPRRISGVGRDNCYQATSMVLELLNGTSNRNFRHGRRLSFQEETPPNTFNTWLRLSKHCKKCD
jgi:hypothetical protein